jgi:hypothetical protein
MVYVKTKLVYSYEPIDFFEAATEVALKAGHVVFDAGAVTLTLSAPRLLPHPDAASLTAEVRAVMLARQILTQRAFTLLGPRVTHHDAEGRKHHVMLAGTGRFELRGQPVDFRVGNAAGAVVRDTKADRIQDETAFVQVVGPNVPTSPTLRRMLESYGRSIEDPLNALVYLYEIRDAAASHFKNDATARQQLNVPDAEWSALGRLANAEPIVEGRHRGKREATRSATADELTRARGIARMIIEAFARIV